MAELAESSARMKRLGLRSSRRHSEEELRALREEVERAVARSEKLRQMAERVGCTPADVASEALARWLSKAPEGVENPEAWMMTAGRNFIYGLARKGLQHETALEPGSWPLEQAKRGDQVPIEEELDRRYEGGIYDAAIGQLEARERQAIVAFEKAGSMRGVERRYGISKSSVCRAFARMQKLISEESGALARRRARSRALAFHLGLMSAPQAAMLRARLKWDIALLSEVRTLRDSANRVGALFPAPVAVQQGDGSGLGERVGALVERVRESAYSLAGSGQGGESAAGGALAGTGQKIAALCAGGAAAASCVGATGVDASGDGASGS